MERVNVPGSAQPATARCVARLPHQRTPSFIPAILRQGCVPQGAHPHHSATGKGLLPAAISALTVGADGQGEAFRLPKPPPAARQGTRGVTLEAGTMLQSDVMQRLLSCSPLGFWSSAVPSRPESLLWAPTFLAVGISVDLAH